MNNKLLEASLVLILGCAGAALVALMYKAPVMTCIAMWLFVFGFWFFFMWGKKRKL